MEPRHTWRLIVHDPSCDHIGLVSRMIYELQESWHESCQIELTSDPEALKRHLSYDPLPFHGVIELVSETNFRAGRTDLHVSILPETILAIQIARREECYLKLKNTATYEAITYEGEECVREAVYWVRNQLLEHEEPISLGLVAATGK